MGHTGALPSFDSIAPFVPTILKRVEEVNLVLSVTDRRGRFVEHLNPSDLVISDNGELADKITYFQRQTDLPLRVALVVDTSNSVTRRLAFEKHAAEAFLQGILRPESDLAMVISFNEQAMMAQPATDDITTLGAAIGRLMIKGDTSVYDAVAFAADALAAVPDLDPVRRVIVLITDGQDNSSRMNLVQAADRALRAECVIYLVNTETFVGAIEDKQAERARKYLVDATGGSILDGDSNREVARSLQKIQKELRSQYAVSYRPHALIGGLRLRTIRIQGPKGVRLRYRTGYYAR